MRFGIKRREKRKSVGRKPARPGPEPVDGSARRESAGTQPQGRESSGVARAVGNARILTLGELLAMQRIFGNQAMLRVLSPPDSTCSDGSSRPAAETGKYTNLRSSRMPSSSAGQPLESGVRRTMEAWFRRSFGSVRVHADASAAEAAEALDASAFTQGTDIFFGRGMYRPHTDPGRRLLSHELAHVVQQQGSSGPLPARSIGGRLEAQASRVESAFAVGPGPHISTGVGVGVQRKAKKEEEEKKDSKSWLHSLGQGFARLGKALWRGAAAAGRVVWKGIKAVGRGVAAAAEAVWTGVSWFGRQLWDKLTGIFGRVAHWVGRLPQRVGRLLTGLWEGIRTLQPWSLAWWEALGRLSTWKQFLAWLGSRLIDLLEIAGIGEVYETVNDFIKFNTRALTGGEVRTANSVFGNSIDFDLVRVDERAVLGPAFTDRAYTSFHTINAWGGLDDDVLIHELTHVWQYEKAGALYMAQALHAQATRGLGAYNYGGVPGLQTAQKKGQGFSSFNREEQAQIMQDFYRIKQGQAPWIGSGTSADLPLYVRFVKEVSTLTDAQLLA